MPCFKRIAREGGLITRHKCTLEEIKVSDGWQNLTIYLSLLLVNRHRQLGRYARR